MHNDSTIIDLRSSNDCKRPRTPKSYTSTEMHDPARSKLRIVGDFSSPKYYSVHENFYLDMQGGLSWVMHTKNWVVSICFVRRSEIVESMYICHKALCCW